MQRELPYLPQPPEPGRSHCETFDELLERRPELRPDPMPASRPVRREPIVVVRIEGPDSVAHTFRSYRTGRAGYVFGPEEP